MSSVQSPHDAFSLTVLPERKEVWVVPTGELDVASADTLHGKVRELRASGFEHIVVDLRRTAFMDSAGLRVLLSLRNDAVRNRQVLSLIHI